MKSRNETMPLAFLTVLALALASCGSTSSLVSGGEQSSNASSGSSSSSASLSSSTVSAGSSYASSSSSAGDLTTPAAIYQAIASYAHALDFTLGYSYSGAEYEDIYADSYISYGMKNGGGYLSLPTYDQEDYPGNVAYGFSLDSDGEVVLGVALAYEDDFDEWITTQLSEYQYLTQLVDGSSFSSSDIVDLGDGVFATTSSDACYYFGYLLGYQSQANFGDFTRVLFSLEDSSLHFELQESEDEDYVSFPDGFGTLEGKDSSSNVTIAEYVADNSSLPSQTAEESASFLKESELTVNTEVTMRFADGSSEPYDSTSVHVDYDDGLAEYDYGGARYVYKESGDYYKVYQEYLDGSNTIQGLDTGYAWGVDFLLPQDTVDLKVFRGDDGARLDFYGLNAFEMMDSLTIVGDYDVGSGFWNDIYANVSNGVLTDIHGESEYLTSDQYSQAFQLVYDVDVESGTTIAEPQVLSGDSAVKESFNNVIAKMKQPAFSAIATDDEDSNSGFSYTYVPDEVLLLDDFANGDHAYSGFIPANGDQGLIEPFAFDPTTGTLKATAPGSSGTLTDYFPWTISSAVLEFEADDDSSVDGTYSLNSAVFSIGSQTFFGGNYGSYALPSSFAITVSDGLISRITFDYYQNGTSGSEEIAFDYSSPVSLPEGFAVSDLVDWVDPTDWQDAYPDTIYQDMVTYFGEYGSLDATSQALAIPYVYYQEINGDWFDYQTDGGYLQGNALNLWNSYYHDFDMSQYVASLKAVLDSEGSGFVLTSEENFDGDGSTLYEYANDSAKVEIVFSSNASLTDGIYVYDLEQFE